MKFERMTKVLFPKVIDQYFPGRRLSQYVFTGLAFISLARSLVHIFAPDGGAGSIAGMNYSVDGASGIVFAFALWGSSQLVYAVIQLLVAFRYRALIPAMYFLLIIEMLLRMLVGRTKPVDFAELPPGAWGNFILLPLALGMLILCFVQPKNS